MSFCRFLSQITKKHNSIIIMEANENIKINFEESDFDVDDYPIEVNEIINDDEIYDSYLDVLRNNPNLTELYLNGAYV